MGMGVTFALAGVVLVLVPVLSRLPEAADAVLLSLAALSFGLGAYGVCRYLDDLRGGKAFENLGVAAILTGAAVCALVIWQTTRAAGVWLVLLLIVLGFLVFFALVGIGIGAGEYAKESAERRQPPARTGARKRGTPAKTRSRALSRYEVLSLLAILLTSIFGAAATIIAAVIQARGK